MVVIRVELMLLEYMLLHSILSEKQYGFLPNRSTQEAVFEMTKAMYSTINNRKIMAMNFLDVGKAFNCIYHERLYNKLESVGCSNRSLKWFRSYLNRTQLVSCTNKKSNVAPVLSGIAQGTVLGPLIYIFYLNDCTGDIKMSYIYVC